MISRGPWFLAVAIAVLFTMGGQQGHAVVVVAVLASAAAFVAYVHPQLIYYSYAAALGLLPFGSVPGAGISLVLTLALGVWAAAVVHWDFSRKLGAIEWVVVFGLL